MNEALSGEPIAKDTRWRELGFLAAVAVLFTPIFWLTRLDIVSAGWFYNASLAEPWFAKEALICQIFFYAPPVLIGLIVIAAVFGFVTGGNGPLAKGRRRASVILLAAVLLGPGVLVNAVFKNHWGRPRPNSIQEFGGREAYRPPLLKGPAGGKSFPSGHPSMAFVFAVFYLVLREKRRRLARAMLAASFLLGMAMGVARMAAGAHFLSDVLWSMLITWFAAWAAYYGVMALDVRRGEAAGGRKLGAAHWLAISLGVTAIVAGLLFITPVNRRAVFEWPAGVAVPETLVVRAPGALVKVKVEPATAAGGAAFGLRQTIQGFGLPWNRLRVRQDKAAAAATWNYEARARGVYTELENVLTITVRDPAVRVLRVETGGVAKVEVEGDQAGSLKIIEVPVAGAAAK